MRVLVVRHSNAVDEGPGLPDEDRYLSARGRERARFVAERLAEEGVAFDQIVTSPLVRAVQTAEILARGVGYDGVVSATHALGPGAPPEALVERLGALGTSVMLVGHEPTISRFPVLLGAPTHRAFAPAQAVLLDAGRLTWTLDPDTGRLSRPE